MDIDGPIQIALKEVNVWENSEGTGSNNITYGYRHAVMGENVHWYIFFRITFLALSKALL